MRSSFLFFPAVLGAALAFSGSARANGRYPAAGQIAVHPKDPSVMLVRATYGLVVTHDTGKSWSWLCEGAVGYGNVEDPMMAFTSEGTLLAGLFEGLSAGSGDACQWTFYPPLKDKYVIDLALDKVDPSKGVLIISNSVGQDDAGAPIFLTQLWQTADAGKTWAQAGVDLPQQFLGLTCDTAPSDPQRVYVSGRYGPPDYPGVIERSDDRGATWQKLTIPGADSTHLPYIGGVDPTNHDVVYVRLDSDPSDALLVSKDGGLTWMTSYTAKGKLYGFAISPDGATVAIGGDKDGVLTAPAATLQFTKVSDVGVKCLTWATSGLYACADEFKDKFTAGVSADQGKTFTALMHLPDVCPLVCPQADSPVNTQCPVAWASTSSTIGATCGLDAGTGGGGGGGADGGRPPDAGSSGSCSWSFPDSGAGGAAALSAVGFAAAWLRARRRRARG